MFVEVFGVIVASLYHIKKNTDRTCSRAGVKGAYALYHGIITFEFTVPMAVDQTSYKATAIIQFEYSSCS